MKKNRRLISKLFTWSATVVFSLSVNLAGADEKPKGKRPNIVLIVADDLGYNDLSSYGNKLISTPNIDALVKEGTNFSQGYVSAPICSPSRAGLMTGRYQQRFGYEFFAATPETWGVQDQAHAEASKKALQKFGVFYTIDGLDLAAYNKTPQGLPASEITIASLLKNAGYKTGIIGKWNLGETQDFIPEKYGFDYHYGFLSGGSRYGSTDDVDLVVKDLPHLYWNAQIIKYGKGPVKLRKNNEVISTTEYLTTRFGDEAASFIEANKADPFFLYVPFNAPHDPLMAKKEDFAGVTTTRDSTKRVYEAMVKSLDDAVGTITKKLSDLGLDKNTLIIFTSDNGGAMYTHVYDNKPLRAGKATHFEGGIRVPYIAKYPGTIPASKIYNNPVSTLDFLPTIAAAAGVKLPEHVFYDGVNLLPFVNGKVTGIPHQTLYWRSGWAKAIRSGDYKLYINEKEHKKLLFNIKEDLSEQHDLSQKNPDKVSELNTRLLQWEKTLAPPAWPSVWYMEYKNGDEVNYFPI
ncbi:sulfatase-like hydrolase/transferase [Pedobacter sp. HMF7647]|uniref:Sulfatase-like hydrolase/transferase n=1 Tax=Hufsiella arboris TaxID=2695275 RepID=A0A7K1YBZ6_9SPHI|nr:sulfatase [Hufsiella arboris]MXV51891.1 sulfatase-like hydrolase/transferase [Hufsiella arboris]